jgi:preprotein translocase subunit SecD
VDVRLCAAVSLAAVVLGSGSAQAKPTFAIFDWEPNVIAASGWPLGAHAHDYRAARTPLRTYAAALSRAARARQHTRLPVAVVQAPPTAPGGKSRGWFVLREQSALRARQITHPQQNFDPKTGEPIVVFGFTASGRSAFARLTRRVAERGAALRLPHGEARRDAFQHIAFVLNGSVLSLPYIDFFKNPHGIDGRNGAEIGGFGTIAAARRVAHELKLAAA